MTSISRFPPVIASSFTDGSTMKPKAAVGRRNRKRASNGIRLCFRTAWKKIDEIAIPMRFKWKTVYSYSADWAESIRRRIRAVPTAKRSLLPNTYVLRSSSLRILCPDSEDLSRSKRENSFTSHFFLSR